MAESAVHERTASGRTSADAGDPEALVESRRQQDNEQWHLLILEELIQQRGTREGWLRFKLIPQLLALVYYHVSWLLYVIAPSLSYALNADFEDHAEHEYMGFVAEHHELDDRPWSSGFAREYGEFASEADLLRQIGVDERHHKEESLGHLGHERFSPA